MGVIPDMKIVEDADVLSLCLFQMSQNIRLKLNCTKNYNQRKTGGDISTSSFHNFKFTISASKIQDSVSKKIAEFGNHSVFKCVCSPEI